MSKRFSKAIRFPACSLAAIALTAGPVMAQQAQPLQPVASDAGTVVVPESSRPSVAGTGTSHTNFEIFVPSSSPMVLKGSAPDRRYETPASLACVYRRVLRMDRCSPEAATLLATGGSRLIAIVDAYDHPNIVGSLATYSQTFGLPAADFSVVFASGSRPPQDPTGDWEIEEALDVEMAHALAPRARIVLVEATSNSDGDLYAAVDVASNLVAQAGGGEVSMSFSRPETSGDGALDAHFRKTGVVYLASSGDQAGVGYPSTSAYVVSVGGTTIVRDPGTRNFFGEATWSDGGGGPSANFPSPDYQAYVRYLSGPMRDTPDIAAVANPNSPVNIYSSIPGSASNTGWQLVGGTSVSAPLVASIVNATGTFRPSSFGELFNLYSHAGGPGLRSITRGICGPGGSYDPTPTWNACVGLGSPERSPPF